MLRSLLSALMISRILFNADPVVGAGNGNIQPTVSKSRKPKTPKAPKKGSIQTAKGKKGKGKNNFGERVGIVAFLTQFFIKGGTKQGCLAEMVKKFKGRDKVAMYRTINTQLSSHLKKRYNITKTESKKEGEGYIFKMTLKPAVAKELAKKTADKKATAKASGK